SVALAAVVAQLAATLGPAGAFCGFYVAKAESKLFNKSSKVVLSREGETTAITMASDYAGEPKEFAVVIPVPTFIERMQISLVETRTINHLDAFTAPRLVVIMPTSNTACFQVFLAVLARKFARRDILLVLDGAPNHRCGDLTVPHNITLLYLPPYSPQLNPKENLWDEIREKIFKNYALKSMDAVRAKLRQAILYIERNPKLVRSITSFPYIANSL